MAAQLVMRSSAVVNNSIRRNLRGQILTDSRLCVKALLVSKISQGFEGFEDFICTGLYGFVPSSISSGSVRCYNRSQNLFSINP